MAEAATPPEGREPVQIPMVLAVMLDQLADLAWQKLGLRHDVMTGRIEADLEQAKLAIDVVSDLVKHLEPHLDESDLRQVQSALRDLKLNYAERSK